MTARRTHLISQEVDKIRARLGTLSGDGAQGDLRYDRPIAKAFLLAGWWTYNGRFLEPVAKHLGLGVYKLTSKDK